MFCKKCGANVLQGQQFCIRCGARLETSGDSPVTQNDALKAGASQRLHANVSPPHSKVAPFKYLCTHIKASVKGIGSVFKNARAVIALAIMAVIWILFSLLPLLGINPLPVQILSLLTFSQGGLYNGVHGALGGIAGKILFAYLAMPLLTGQNPFKGVPSGFKRIPAAFGKGVPPGLFFIGFGIAPILYNFMAGSTSLMTIMAAFAAFLLCIRAMGAREGFLSGFVSSVLDAYTRRGGASPYNESIIAGLAAGFLLSIPLSLLVLISLWQPILGYVCYFTGLGLLIIGITLQLVSSGRKGVHAL